MMGSPDEILGAFQEAGRLDVGDFMRFEVRPDPTHPEIQNDGMKYDGYRFRAECRLAGRIYGRPFGVDVAFGDPLVGAPDLIVTEDLLGFAGIEPPTLRIYPVVSHIAEKLHAYTMPRSRPNSRVKDLPDLGLLATVGTLDAATLRAALELTFTFRATHALPVAVPPPPAFWQAPYEAMVEAYKLVWRTLAEVHSTVVAFLDPVLAGGLEGAWDRDAWLWRDTDGASEAPGDL